jgi:hypothetical protein
MKKHFLPAIITAIFAAVSVRAQIGGIVNQVGDAQTREQLNRTAQAGLSESNSVPQLYEGETSDVGPQSVVQTKARHTLFEAYADAQFFYSDNVFLTEKRKVDTGVLVSTVEFALAPTPYAVGNGTLAPRLGYQHQWFDFGLGGAKLPGTPLQLRDFDFNAQTVFADALWTQGKWSFGGGLDATRLMQTDGYHQFYEELVPNWIARRTFSLNDQTAFAMAYEGDYRVTSIEPQFLEFATSDANDRTDHSLVLTLTHVLCKHAVLQPYYRMKYTHFTEFPNSARNDYLNSLGAGLYLLVCPHFTVRTFVNYDILVSGNPRVENYHKLDAGGGIDVSFRF